MLPGNLPAAGHSGPPSDESATPQSSSSALKRLTALALGLLLLPISQADLFAQQQPYPGPQQPYSYSGQYDPAQQSDYGQPAYDQAQPGYGQPQPLGPAQLEQLVAPIALNPDSLVALMLAASTYPNQVAAADRWRQSQGNASPDQIAYGAGLQNWDPSVKALTAFPQVLAEMDQNSQWTAALGNAYYNQPQDVLQAIQIMRQRAQAAGNLQSTPQEDVSYNQGYIQLAPANPQVVYVPAYNPWAVYGQPVTPYPGFSLLGALGSFFNSSFGSSAVQFGLGMVMSAFNHTPFGLIGWGLNWLTQNLLFNHSDYYSNSPSVADWGLRYGGPRAYMAPHRQLAGYNRSYGRGYDRGYGQNFNRSQSRYSGNQSQYAGNWPRENYNRNYQTSAYRTQQPYGRKNYGPYNRSVSPFANRTGYTQNRSLQAYDRNISFNRSQSYIRPAHGSNYGSQAYRAPSSGFDRNNFGQRSSTAYRGNSFIGSSNKSSHSGGFHLFGSGHNSSSFGHESFKAPKAYKAPKGFGVGGHHSFGGGHSNGHSGGGHGGGHGGGRHH
ncbi:MAG: DUF3300 domain-containing protein [Silvibacterium sp.]